MESELRPVAWMVVYPNGSRDVFLDQKKAENIARDFANDKPTPLYSSPDREAATREAVTALDEIREHVVLAIAFLGRDLGTARMETTLPQVIAGLVKADASLRALAQQAKPQQEKI